MYCIVFKRHVFVYFIESDLKEEGLLSVVPPFSEDKGTSVHLE